MRAEGTLDDVSVSGPLGVKREEDRSLVPLSALTLLDSPLVSPLWEKRS